VEKSFLIELKQGFLEEAQELLGRVEALSLQLEKDPSRSDIFAEFARLAHNFKGSGKAVGFEHISTMSHRLEDYILSIQKGQIPATGENIDFLFRCLDRLKADVEILKIDLNAELDHSSLIREITQRIDGMFKNNPIDLPIPPKAMAAHPVDTAQKPAEVFRVPKQKLDSLMEIVGEQVILQSFLEQCKDDVDGNRELLMKTISQLSKLTFEIQNQALSLTMIQMVPLFTKLERATRDASRSCNKPIDIHLSGAETEIDKTLIDGLSDALTHIVRNAVDHGLEDAEERIRVGKKETGCVHIEARRSGGQLWIEIKDDGKGMNPEFLKQKALLKGLISEQEAALMKDQEAFQLIFKNGFSTKEAVSELSGRGVGMNVVEETVKSLKGSIDIESILGKGTCFRLKLPLSLAIFNGAIVKVRDSRFVVPSSEISEISRIQLGDRVLLGKNSYGIKIRDELFELVDLRVALFDGAPDSELPKKEYPVLLSRDGRPRAYLVNEIVGIQKIVQKMIGDEVKSRAEYAAGTILGDGTPGIILSLRGLVAA
jgi:two-component system chemotaxis sensor kinase CheA